MPRLARGLQTPSGGTRARSRLQPAGRSPSEHPPGCDAGRVLQDPASMARLGGVFRPRGAALSPCGGADMAEYDRIWPFTGISGHIRSHIVRRELTPASIHTL